MGFETLFSSTRSFKLTSFDETKWNYLTEKSSEFRNLIFHGYQAVHGNPCRTGI